MIYTLRTQGCPISNTYLFANGYVAKPCNRPAITASLRLDNCSCVVLLSLIHGLVALDENLHILNGVFSSAREILSSHAAFRHTLRGMALMVVIPEEIDQALSKTDEWLLY